jgi:hypothetical protein
MPCVKATHLFVTLQDQVSDVLHRVLKEVYETIKAIEDSFGDQHLVRAYHNQLMTRNQCSGESLQEFATAVKQVATAHILHYLRTT